MSAVIEKEILGLPKSLNGSHGHWRAAAAERKEWRMATRMAFYYSRPEKPFTKIKLTCIRFSSRKMDFDNLAASFKGCVDGLVDAKIIIDDSDDIIVLREYKSAPAKRGEGKIIIRVEEMK